MKKTKTEIALICDAIQDLLVRQHNTDILIDNPNSRMHQAEDFVVQELRESNADMYNKIEDLERRIKKQEETISRLMANKQEEPVCRLLADMSNLATDYMDLRVKLGDMATTVASLVADKDALISHNKCLSQRENELQAQVDELQAQVDDQFEAIGRLSTGMENVAKSLTNLDGWLNSVEVVLSALRKSA
jgi:DNA repair exonuclease SbcCD ATPase subunit